MSLKKLLSKANERFFNRSDSYEWDTNGIKIGSITKEFPVKGDTITVIICNDEDSELDLGVYIYPMSDEESGSPFVEFAGRVLREKYSSNQDYFYTAADIVKLNNDLEKVKDMTSLGKFLKNIGFTKANIAANDLDLDHFHNGPALVQLNELVKSL